MAWRELFKGHILTDIILTEANLQVDEMVTKTAQKNPKNSAAAANQVGQKLFPVEVERVEIRNSSVEYKNIFVDQIEGRLSHFTATESNPISLLTLRGFFLGKTALKIVGDLNLLQTPVAWRLAAEVQKFNLPEAQVIVSQFVPLTFKKGQLDVNTEIKSEHGKVSGYIKPFLKEGEVIGDDKDFKSIKHFGVEISVAFLNLFFRSTQNHVLATKILFSYENKNFQWNLNEMISELFKNGYQEELPRGIENILSLSSK